MLSCLINGLHEKALVWVDGMARVFGFLRIRILQITIAPPELAIDLSGEEYNEPLVSPDGPIVMFRYFPAA